MLYLLGFLAIIQVASPAKPFAVGPRGPHGGELVRAVPQGPHTELPGYYEDLYFELTSKKEEIVFYAFVVPPYLKGFLLPVSPEKELREYRVSARSSETDIKLMAYRLSNALYAVFASDDISRLGIKAGAPCALVVTVIHEGMSKEAIFNNFRPD